MTRLPRIPGSVLLVGILAAPTVARADTIRITSGAAVSRSDQLGVVDVTMASPDHGFSLAAAGDAGGGTYDLYNSCFLSPACVPGHVVSMFASWIGSDFAGTATADGLAFPLGTGGDGIGSAEADFKWHFYAPAVHRRDNDIRGRSVHARQASWTIRDRPPIRTSPNLFPRSRTLVGSGFATIESRLGRSKRPVRVVDIHRGTLPNSRRHRSPPPCCSLRRLPSAWHAGGRSPA